MSIAIILLILLVGNGVMTLSSKQSSGEIGIQNYKFVLKWGSNGTGPGHFDRPHDVDFDSKGYVYVTDRELDDIQKFTHNGSFVKMWGSRGLEDGQFKFPTVLA